MKITAALGRPQAAEITQGAHRVARSRRPHLIISCLGSEQRRLMLPSLSRWFPIIPGSWSLADACLRNPSQPSRTGWMTAPRSCWALDGYNGGYSALT